MLLKICVLLILTISLTNCTTTTPSGDAGCGAYGEARLAMPSDADLRASPKPVSRFVVSVDTGMTATCRK